MRVALLLLTLAASWAAFAHFCARRPLLRSPASGASLRIARPLDLISLEPASSYNDPTLDALYEPLYQFSYASSHATLEPLLAAGAPRFSANSMVARISVRPGVRFADDPCFHSSNGRGREVTAEDFVYSLKRTALPMLSGAWWAFDQHVEGLNALHDSLKGMPREEALRALRKPVAGLSAVDRYTLEIRLTKPYPQLPFVLARRFSSVVPLEAVEAYGSQGGELVDHAVGTGPFVMAERRVGQGYTLLRNPSFHADSFPLYNDALPFSGNAGHALPLVNRIDVFVIKESLTAWLRFLKGELDIVTLPRELVPVVLSPDGGGLSPEYAARNYGLAVSALDTTYYIPLNMQDPLLGGNRALRQALASAMDREEWRKIFGKGLALQPAGLIPPAANERPERLSRPPAFDVVRAKRLMSEAGFPEGKGLPPIDIDFSGATTENRLLAEFLARGWGKIGVRINPSFNTPPTFRQKMSDGRFQLMPLAWALDYPDPENILSILYGPHSRPGPNVSGFRNARFDSLFEKISSAPSGPDRLQWIDEAESVVENEVPWIVVGYPREAALLQPWVKNYRMSSMILNWMKYVGTTQTAR